MFTLTLVREGGGEHVELPNARLRLKGPGRSDQCVALGLKPIVLGSAPDCDLQVDDPYISRHHCELTLDTKGILVRDLGSRNGVWAQTTRIYEALLQPSTGIRIGQLSITVESGGDPVRVALSGGDRFGEAVGKSMVMRALFAQLERAAQTDEPVLLCGESGTGKEILAHAIHQASPRRQGPFIIFDCGAVSQSLIESELFGHEKGAFSGANTNRIGLIQAAQGGTLFLDEIGELPLDLQPKLLRVLENKTIRPVGSNRTIPVDMRILAATHRDLSLARAAREFRDDLYYRLAVVEGRVPPLRERREDIPLLVTEILTKRSPPASISDLPKNTLAMLMAHSWPGNVRELRNMLSRLILFNAMGSPEGEHAAAQDGTPASVPAPAEAGHSAMPDLLHLPFHEAREVLLADFERRYAAAQLATHEGNVSAAARAAGVSRQFLHKLISEHALRGST